MGNYPWFCKTIRTAVTQSAAIATVLRAILEGRKPRIPEKVFTSLESRDIIEEAIENSRILRQTKEGRKQLRKLIADHRYKAGFRLDDIALRQAYVSWCEDKEDVPLPRIEKPKRKRA